MGVGTFWDYLEYGLLHEGSAYKGSFAPAWIYKTLAASKLPYLSKAKLLEDLGRTGYEAVKLYTSDYFAVEAPPATQRAIQQTGSVSAGPELALTLIPRKVLKTHIDKLVDFRDGSSRLLAIQREKGAPEHVIVELVALVQAAAAALNILYRIEDAKDAKTDSELGEHFKYIRENIALQKEHTETFRQSRAQHGIKG